MAAFDGSEQLSQTLVKRGFKDIVIQDFFRTCFKGFAQYIDTRSPRPRNKVLILPQPQK